VSYKQATMMRWWGWCGIFVAVSVLIVGASGIARRRGAEATDRVYERIRPERYARFFHIPEVSRQPDIIIIDHFCLYPLRHGRCPRK
jgi:hypothetical protein